MAMLVKTTNYSRPVVTSMHPEVGGASPDLPQTLEGLANALNGQVYEAFERAGRILDALTGPPPGEIADKPPGEIADKPSPPVGILSHLESTSHITARLIARLDEIASRVGG